MLDVASEESKENGLKLTLKAWGPVSGPSEPE